MNTLTPSSNSLISIARSQTLGDVLRRTAQRLPQKTAIICGQTQWSYGQFDALVNRLAAGLFAMGIQTGDHVAMLARNSHGFAAMRFALARMGAVLIPINFMLKADEVAYILRHAQARVLVTDTELTPLAQAAAAMDTQVSSFIWIPSEEETLPSPGMHNFHTLAAAEGVLPSPTFSSTDILQIVYTSGTESSP